MNTHYALISFSGDFGNDHPDPTLRGCGPSVSLIAVGTEDFCLQALAEWTKKHPLQRDQEAEIVRRDPSKVKDDAYRAAIRLAESKGKHLVVVSPYPDDPENMQTKIVCPQRVPGRPCGGPFYACSECQGFATYFDEELDDEQDCEACQMTGWDQGRFRCWLKDDPDGVIRDQILEFKLEPGIYSFEYETNGSGDEFETEITKVELV